MHLRAKKKQWGEVSIYEPVVVDKEGNEISFNGYFGDLFVAIVAGLSATCRFVRSFF